MPVTIETGLPTTHTQNQLRRGLDRFLSTSEVCEIRDCSRTTLWREVKAGRFPRPAQLSPHRVGFLESEVREWILAKVRDRDEGAK